MDSYPPSIPCSEIKTRRSLGSIYLLGSQDNRLRRFFWFGKLELLRPTRRKSQHLLLLFFNAFHQLPALSPLDEKMRGKEKGKVKKDSSSGGNFEARSAVEEEGGGTLIIIHERNENIAQSSGKSWKCGEGYRQQCVNWSAGSSSAGMGIAQKRVRGGQRLRDRTRLVG